MTDKSYQSPFNEDSSKQAANYLKAINDLRQAVNSLGKPITDVSIRVRDLNMDFNKLSSTVNQMAKDSQTADGANNKLTDGLEKLTKTYDALTESLKIIRGAFASLEVGLTAGLSLIIAYGPEVWNIVKSWISGKETISQVTLSINTLNKALGSNDVTNATKQFNELKINIGLAKQGTLSKIEVLKHYNETLGKTLGHADNLNQAENKLVTEGPSYIQMTLNKAAAQIALQDAAKKSYEAQKIRVQTDDETLTFWDKAKSYALSLGNPVGAAMAQTDLLITATEKRKQNSKNAEDESVKLLKTAANYQKAAALIAKQHNLLFEPKEENNIHFLKWHKAPAKPKPNTSRPTEILEAHMSPILTTFEEEKKLYDKEVAALDEKLGKQLISQTEYNTQSKQLQEKYHQGISLQQEEFVKKQMDATMQHLKDVAEAGRLEKAIGQDQKDLNKAILPGQQLAAEKKLIADKYDYEIALAGGNTEKIKQLELDKQKALTDVANQYEQQRKEFALNTAKQVADKAFSIIGNNIKSTSDAKLKGLETQKAGELSNTSLTATQRKAIEDKYKKKEAEEKLKAFKSEQRASLLQAIVNGALAVTKVTAQTGVFAPFVIPAIIASTALQVATILAQKPPAFARGGHFVSDGRGAVLPGYSRTDNTNAYLRSGEAVVVSEAMRNPWARNLVSAINVAHGGRDFSVPNTGRGYAIGGIYTDGGNANRYYNQPVNDAKELANTLAYQMINNFPPIYVDVKDVNNQQNILAQTVNRVNL